MFENTRNVLIFGPTGGVGRAAAFEAHERGAHVWLAMRDTTKEIPGIPADTQGYTRIQADLAQPETLTHAVKQSGATTAFVYTLFNSQDAMHGCFDALKASGIQYVTLLSSFIVRGDPHDEANNSSFIAKVHAKAEATLRDSGIKYAAIRPAYFSTNVLLYYDGIKKGHVDLIYPQVKLDFIAPEDIGAVCAAILVAPPTQNENVYLCGPKLIAQQDAIKIIAEVLERNVKTKAVSEDEWKEGLKGKMPPAALDNVASAFRKSDQGEQTHEPELYTEVSKNIRRWTGRESMSLREWAQNNRAAFL